MNKKMEKLGLAPVAAEASVASTVPSPAADAATAPAIATTPPPIQAPSGQEILATQPSPTNSIRGSGGGGGGGAGTLPKWPPFMGGSQSSMLASHVKALNLEPANRLRVRPMPLRPPQSPLPQQQQSVALQSSPRPVEELAAPQPVAPSPQQHQLALAQPAMQPSPQQHRQRPPKTLQQASPSNRPKNSGSKLVNKKLVNDSPTQKLSVVDSLAVMDSELSSKPADGIFDKTLMLRIWGATKVAHPQVVGLHTQPRPGEKPTPASDRRRKPPQTPDVLRPKATPTPSTPAQILERKVRSLLNKICPDNLQVITEQLAAIELKNVEQLETIIKLIFGIALTDPHYCETYADMVFTLKNRYPEFPAERE